MTTLVRRRGTGLFGWSLARVDGDSMAPALMDGDYVLARRDREPAKPDAIVLVEHPTMGRLVKRVRTRDDRGRFLVGGDNMLSIDSEGIGALPGAAITGRVRWRLSPKGLQRIPDGVRA